MREKLSSHRDLSGEIQVVGSSRFREVIDKMPRYMDELVNCEPLAMYTTADRRGLRRKLPASKGVYVLYEQHQPMYVGRSDNLADRLLEHGRQSGDSETATFAFNIAKEQYSGPTSMSRSNLQGDKEFRPLFQAAKERVRRRKARVVGVIDPIEQTILEVYTHMKLDTPFNSFENH